jgi:hypothetical protein
MGEGTMKKALVLIAILATVTAANATVRIFFTNASEGYGLTDASLAQTVSVFDDSIYPGVYDDYEYAVSAFPPAGYNTLATAEPGELVYVWLRFESDTNGAKINGLHLGTDAGAGLTFYKMQGYKAKRWQNEDNNELAMNPSVMKAVTTDGIVNSKGATDDPLYDNTTRTTLLGAMVHEGGFANLVLADLGLSYDGLPRPSLTFGFPVDMNGNPLQEEINTFPDPEPSPDATWTTTYPNLAPEPASLLLLGLAGLVLRRR